MDNNVVRLDVLSAPTSPGALFQHIRSGLASTRAELARLTGLSRSTVGQRVEDLLTTGLVVEAGEAPSTGGRKPTRLRFEPAAGVVLAADLGATHARVGVTDLDGTVLANVADNVEIARGPEEVLTWVDERFAALLERLGRTAADVRGIGVGLPGPVEHDSGTAVSPPIMPGWDGYPVPGFFRDRYAVPVFVDNDVNVMALGEYWVRWRDTVDDLLFIKVGTGIGCGIVASGRIHRGAQGAAGDLGHVRVPGHDDARCRCGNTGCIEAVAGGQALADDLAAQGYDTPHARDVVALVRAGNGDATRLVRDAGRALGDVLAAAVNFFNPAVIVIGGNVATSTEQLLAGVRETVYQRSLPLATRHLRIVSSTLGDHAGVLGAAVMVIEEVLAASAIDLRIAERAREVGA